MDVTLVIVNYNGRAYIDRCLRAVEGLLERPPVLVWDNASSDGSVEHLRTAWPHVRVVASEANLGFAAAVNRAVEMVETPRVALLNPDAEPAHDWLQRLTTTLEEAPPEVVAVGSRLVLKEDTSRLHHDGCVLAPIGGGMDVGLLGVAPPPGAPRWTAAFCGGAALVDRGRFLDLGGFCGQYFLFMENAEFGMRAWMSGQRILHDPRALVVHDVGSSSGQLASGFRLRLAQRHRLHMLMRLYPWSRIAVAVPAMICFVVGAAGMLVLMGRPASAWGLVRGGIEGLTLVPAALRSRCYTRAGWRALREHGLVLSYAGFLREMRRLRWPMAARPPAQGR